MGILIGPFLAVDAPSHFTGSWTAIVRAVQMLGARLTVLVRAAAAAEWIGPLAQQDLSQMQTDLANDIDSCLSALNANNPALAQPRPGWSNSNEAWKRRGEISTQGAALKLKLSKTSDKRFLTVSRKKIDSPSPSATSASLPAAAALEGSPIMSETKLLRTSSGSVAKLPKQKRTSGEWEEE